MKGWSRTSFKFYAEITTKTLLCVWECRVGAPELENAVAARPHVVKPQASLLVGLGPLVLSLAPC